MDDPLDGAVRFVADRIGTLLRRQAQFGWIGNELTRDRIGRATSHARDVAERDFYRARDFSIRATESHPLAVGAAAIAAGVCVGLLIPETDRENELLGAQRARLVEGARGALEDAKQASTAIKDTAKEAARDVTRDVKNSLTGSTG